MQGLIEVVAESRTVAARTRASVVVLLLAMMLAVVGAVHAQEVERRELGTMSIEDLMSLNVRVASLKGEGLLTSPSMVTVIDSDMIREYNLQSVAEAVNLVAGFSVLRTYFKRDIPTARGVLQDHYANKVLLLINNVPTWMAVTGEGELDRIDIHDVDRIEVLKGPASVLYGTNAYAGAINIVLKNPKEHRSEMQLGIGEDLGFRTGGHFLHAGQDLELLVAANTVDDVGQDIQFSDEAGRSGTVDQFMRRSNLTVQGTIGKHSMLANAYKIDESYLGVVPTFAGGAGRDHELKGALLSYTYATRLGHRTELDAGLTYDWNERDFARAEDGSVRGVVEGYRILGNLKSVTRLSDSWSLEAGLDWERRKSVRYDNYQVLSGEVLSGNNMRGREVDEHSVFLQLGYSTEPVHLVLGTRYTDNELLGDNLSSRATLVYAVSPHQSLKLMAGQSYRVPSLFELYFQTSSNTVFGNTALKPETNDSIELAYVGSRGSLYLEALAYHARYADKIFRVRRYPGFVDDPEDTSLIYINGDEFSADGLELGLAYRRPKALSLFLNYGFVDGDAGDEVGGNDHYNFKYVPEHTVAVGMARYFGQAWVSGVGTYRSEVGAPLEEISAQTTFDLNIGYRHQVDSVVLRHIVSAKNLGDDEVEIPEYVRRRINEVPSGYGRRISYTLQVSF